MEFKTKVECANNCQQKCVAFVFIKDEIDRTSCYHYHERSYLVEAYKWLQNEIEKLSKVENKAYIKCRGI